MSRRKHEPALDMVSAAGFEPATHSLNGLAEREINILAQLFALRFASKNAGLSTLPKPITKPVQAASGHKIGHSLMGRTPPLHAWPKSSVLVGSAMRELGRCRGWITLGRNDSFTFVWRCDFSLLQLRPKDESVPCLLSAPAHSRAAKPTLGRRT